MTDDMKTIKELRAEGRDLADLRARLKATVEALGKVMPTWQGQPITAEVLAKACDLLKAEGWTSPKWDPPDPEVWERCYGSYRKTSFIKRVIRWIARLFNQAKETA